MNLPPIDQRVSFWDGALWVGFAKPIDSIIIDITEPEPEQDWDTEPTVMEFSLGEAF